MFSLLPGAVVSNVASQSAAEGLPLVREPHLVLDVNTGLNRLVLIPTTARHKSGRYYFVGPQIHELDKIECQLNASNPVLTLHTFKARPATIWTDDELDRVFKRRSQSESIALTTLRFRWALIRPLVSSPDKELLFDPTCRRTLIWARAKEILADQTLTEFLNSSVRKHKIKKSHTPEDLQLAQLQRVVKELLRCLNQFWAGGSVRGALIGFTGAMGGRGKPRKSNSAKRGRPNAAVKEGHIDLAGLNIDDESQNAKIIKFCHDTWVVRGTTEATALRQMWTEFFSTAVQHPDGSTKMEWLPANQRPTMAQFRYWGTKDDAASVAWRKHLPPKKFDRSYRAIMGSASDDVFAVGQRGGIDSTPPDLQFVRAVDRLARVGGGHRIIVIDSIFGYIPGLYMGFDAPSATTVRLALYNAMNPDKKGWLEDLGLDQDIPSDDFIPIWFENLWADNTDLRNNEIMSCAEDIGTYIHFVATCRSDLNSMVESGHHVLHRLADHKLAGSTHGKPKERGESSATDRARHTMAEAMREIVRAIHVHNTAEIDDHRPLRMRLKNVPPTRLAMTREMIRIGRIARTHHAIEFARRRLLPSYEGTFTESGVRLHRRSDTKKVEFIRHIAYVGDHPIILSRCEEARRGRKIDPDYFRATFYVDPYRPRHIWFVDPPTGEEIELTIKVLKIRDPDLPFLMTLPDMNDRDLVEGSEKIGLNDSRDRKIGAMEAAQRRANTKAEETYSQAITSLGRSPSKAALRRDKRENRDAEKAGCLFGMPISAQAKSATATVEKAPEESQPVGNIDASPHGVATNSAHHPPAPEKSTADLEQPRPRNSLLRAAVDGFIKQDR